MDDRNRSSRDNPRDEWNDQSYGNQQSDRVRQPEQFQDRYRQQDDYRGYGQMGGIDNPQGYDNKRLRSEYGERSDFGYNRERNFTRGQDLDFDRGGSDRNRGSHAWNRGSGDRYATDAPYSGGLGRPHFDNDRSGFRSFGAGDMTGRDFAGASGRSGYGGGYVGSGGYGAGYGRADDDHRGFFEKAGDEVASWFGDNDAARRREMDHAGRGPSNYNRSDERILEDACDRLTDDRQVDASDITVTVQSGEITLDGTVDSRFAKRRAEDCVDGLSGVRHVQNNLRVKEADRTRSDRKTVI